MTAFTRDAHSGTGPGEFTRDGCSVELYAQLPPREEETGVVLGAVPRGAALLELGAGAGRMTRALAAGGLRVTAVDESAPMLAHIGEVAETVHSAIEDLDLGRRFDAVLLASFLVNTADDAHRSRLLRACARHTAPGGAVLIQREHDGMREGMRPGQTWNRGAMTTTVVSLDPVGDDACRVCLAHETEQARWTQTFFSQTLPRPRLEAALRAAGLEPDAYLTDDGGWVRARPATPPAVS
ncbi:methyltransferase family protein [Streptomyces sp. Amel2xB2]|uniref:class I SAM-dependent methyltransferase n=1 Tax=Streptomyces sp. Amel2xB2 TaxID=1305829 RepID=UPI000DB98F0B|nr:class I SAM-dependent methyltransferase [Streptomyces sp. Amel2xB2]RAJ60530.1 methyltransferase family protein [Streptomyces sp. Amel2xB2]